ncbi:MAG TPA: Co2+/Mg2+ efflux protein ApaG [Flavobacteriaceae bacterium]|nr:Co2+/Mg2+ efflux protein ApaG [Flavobacteriaceae bacterium]
MIYQITRGIKISVTSHFKGNFLKGRQMQYVFSYRIQIENRSNQAIQLLSRYWEIKDSLNHSIYVQGEGVVGRQPIIQPGEVYAYTSGCILKSTTGSMEGYYTMTDMETETLFTIPIPKFQLIAGYMLN